MARSYSVALLHVLVCITSGSADRSLEMVHLVYRHGARSPINFFPNDPNKPDIWPDGPGRLTQYGMTLEYQLGQFLKDRYISSGFLDQLYLHDQVYVYSSDEERCLQSAESQLAGLYPPVGRQVWNEDIAWQPIPVHTVPQDKDPLMRPDDTVCPRLEELFNARFDKPEFIKKTADSKSFVEFVSNMTGMELTTKNFWDPVDTLLCERAQNLTLPRWAVDNWSAMIDLFSWLFLYQYKGDDELGRLTGGALLGLMEKNMKMWSSGQQLDTLHKMNIFSGHDTSILALSTALNIDLGQPPAFASCYLVEMYKVDGMPVVEMRYRNDSSGKLYNFQLNNCQFSCPLDDFIRLTQARIPADRDHECQLQENRNKKGSSRQGEIQILVAAIGVLCVLAILAIVSNIWRRHVFARRHESYKMINSGVSVTPEV